MDRFIEAYDNFKDQRGLVDFADMVGQAAAAVEPLDVDVAYLDEAQDFSLAQHVFLRRACSRAKLIMIAGDDDQAIYGWQGAPLQTYRNLPGRREHLSQSHRIGAGAAFRKAETLVGAIANRVAKPWTPAGTHETSLQLRVLDNEMRDRMEKGLWLLLARTWHLVNTIYRPTLEDWGYRYQLLGHKEDDEADKLETQGRMITDWKLLQHGEAISGKEIKVLRNYVLRGDKLRGPFHKLQDYSMRDLERAGLGHQVPKMDWSEAMAVSIGPERREYLQRCERRNELLAPRIMVGTIHSAKGLESDNVFLLPDYSRKIEERYDRWHDPELRVWFVAVTRARRALNVAPHHYYSRRYFLPLLRGLPRG